MEFDPDKMFYIKDLASFELEKLELYRIEFSDLRLITEQAQLESKFEMISSDTSLRLSKRQIYTNERISCQDVNTRLANMPWKMD